MKDSHGMAGEIRQTLMPPFSAAINKMNEALSYQFSS